MAGLDFGPECRYLGYMNSDVNKKTVLGKKTVLLMTRVSVIIFHVVDIEILRNRRKNISSLKFIMLLMTFIDHVRRPQSENHIYDDCDTNN